MKINQNTCDQEELVMENEPIENKTLHLDSDTDKKTTSAKNNLVSKKGHYEKQNRDQSVTELDLEVRLEPNQQLVSNSAHREQESDTLHQLTRAEDGVEVKVDGDSQLMFYQATCIEDNHDRTNESDEANIEASCALVHQPSSNEENTESSELLSQVEQANVVNEHPSRSTMKRQERRKQLEKPSHTVNFLPLILGLSPIAFIVAVYFYTQSLIVIEKPKPDLGEKIIVYLPTGETVYTYENLIVSEHGKLYYEGERNTIDLTGGKVVYEDWE